MPTATPGLEGTTAGQDGRDGQGDLLSSTSATQPARPSSPSEAGVLDEPVLGLAPYPSARRGGDDRTYLHSVRVFLSYWDIGIVLLDMTDLARPVYLGRTISPASKLEEHGALLLRAWLPCSVPGEG